MTGNLVQPASFGVFKCFCTVEGSTCIPDFTLPSRVKSGINIEICIISGPFHSNADTGYGLIGNTNIKHMLVLYNLYMKSESDQQ